MQFLEPFSAEEQGRNSVLQAAVLDLQATQLLHQTSELGAPRGIFSGQADPASPEATEAAEKSVIAVKTRGPQS